MKYDLPCEVVYELLPMHTDNLLGRNVAESVNAHLDTCTKCKKQFETMKEYSAKAEYKNNANEKSMLKKTRKKIAKLIIGCVAAFIVIFSAVWFLVNYTTTAFHVPLEQVTVTVEQVNIDELNLRKPGDNNDFSESDAYMVGTYGIDGDFAIDEKDYETLTEQGYLQYIVIDSDIRITQAYIDRSDEVGVAIEDDVAIVELYAYHFKTKKPDYYKEKEFIIYENIDKLVYLSNKDGENGAVLWEKTDK